MGKKILITLIATITAVSITSCKKQEKSELAEKANSVFGTIPEKMPGSESDTKDMIALGKKLYFEKGLSVNDSQSCNSCHRVDENLGGVDNNPTSPGAMGKFGGRNSPTVLNAGLQIAQFWDGRAKDLQEQAKGPILNPIEMGMPAQEHVLKKVGELEQYKDEFTKVFPEDGMTYDNLAAAIAAFERTLVTKDRFDDFQNGDESALTEEEKKGLQLFIDTGCTSCHNGPLLGGNSYQKIGMKNPYPNKSDLGRYDVTKKEEDKFVFKVPMLRNVSITGPYFHDGSVKTLDEAVKKMAYHQLDKELADEDVKSIVAFLKSLTDKERAK